MAQLDMSGKAVTKEACADWFRRLQHRSSGATHLKPYGVTWCHDRVRINCCVFVCASDLCKMWGLLQETTPCDCRVVVRLFTMACLMERDSRGGLLTDCSFCYLLLSVFCASYLRGAARSQLFLCFPVIRDFSCFGN